MVAVAVRIMDREEDNPKISWNQLVNQRLVEGIWSSADVSM